MFSVIAHVAVDLNRTLAGKPLVAFLLELENWQIEADAQGKIGGNDSEHHFAVHILSELSQAIVHQRGAQNAVLTRRMLDQAVDSYKGPGAFDLKSGVIDLTETGEAMTPETRREWDNRVHVLHGSTVLNALYTAAQISAQGQYQAYAQAVRDKLDGPIPGHMRLNFEAAALITKTCAYAGRKNRTLFDAFWQLEIERHYVDVLSFFRGTHKTLKGKALQDAFWQYIERLGQDLKLPTDPAKHYEPQHFRAELTYERGKLMSLKPGVVPDVALRLTVN
jgi:hypothetical protein